MGVPGLLRLAGLARSFGVHAEGPFDSTRDLGPALDRAVRVVANGKPALIDVLTQVR